MHETSDLIRRFLSISKDFTENVPCAAFSGDLIPNVGDWITSISESFSRWIKVGGNVKGYIRKITANRS
jgi:hypothetical protein